MKRCKACQEAVKWLGWVLAILQAAVGGPGIGP